MGILTIRRKETLIPLGMFPLGGAGQTRRRHQTLTTLAFLPLAFKDFLQSNASYSRVRVTTLPDTSHWNGKGETAPKQSYKTSI